MSTDTRLLPVRKPRPTGIAQTQFVNRPATMGSGGSAGPVTSSPAASKATRAYAAGAASAGPMRIGSNSVQLMNRPASPGRTAASGGNVGTKLPGPPGSAVASVELLPNVTKGAAPAKNAAPSSPFLVDELMLLAHLVDNFGGDPANESNRELAEGAREKIAALLNAIA